MRKLIALLFILLAQTVLFLAIFRVIPLDDFPFIASMHKNTAVRSLSVMVDSFLELKILAQAAAPQKPPLEAWVYLDEVQKKNEVTFQLYNSQGVAKGAPGTKALAQTKVDERVMKVIETKKDNYQFVKNEVFYAVPLYAQKKCLFCHERGEDSFLGVASISYTDAQTPRPVFMINLVLVLLSFINAIAAVLVILHDPYAPIKELFDKK